MNRKSMEIFRKFVDLLKKSWWIFWYSTKEATIFREKLIVDIVLTLFRVVILLLLYVNIYKIAPQIKTVLPYESAMWSIGAYFVALAFSVRRIYREMSALVQSGNIELFVTRPFNMLGFLAAKILGGNFVMTTVTGITLVLFLSFVVGAPAGGVSLSFVAGALLLLFGGILVETLLAMLVGLIAIWAENSKPIYLIFDKFILILGGSYVPIAFFPKFLQLAAKYSPFGATRFVTMAFYPNFAANFSSLLFWQFFWIVTLGLIVFIVYRKGMNSIFVNGS